MKRTLNLIGLVGCAALLVGSASAAVPKATGSVALSGPLQYASFAAFDQTPVKGSITYTNFELAAPGSGVWAVGVGKKFDMAFQPSTDSNTYFHTITIDSITPLATNSIAFSGTGEWTSCSPGCTPTPGYTFDIQGTVTGTAINFRMSNFALDALDTVVESDPGTGSIGANGSMTGTATGNYPNRVPALMGVAFTWSAAPGSAFEVFSYSAAVTCAIVSNSSAVFGYTIPVAPLAGTPVVVNVTDGGSPGPGHDTWAHGVGTCGGGTSPYTITSGNLVVH